MPYIDDEFIAKLKQKLGDDDEVAKTNIEDTSTQQQFAIKNVDESLVSEVLKKIDRLASFRERSVKELHDRLLREEYDSDAVTCALQRAQNYGLVNDLRYAEMLVRSRLSAGKGRRGIAAELKALNINPDEVLGWPDAADSDLDNEVERAPKIIQKRPPTSKNIRDSAYRRLISKGYSSSVAQTAARLWCDSLEAETRTQRCY